jgi:hypothetical protein
MLNSPRRGFQILDNRYVLDRNGPSCLHWTEGFLLPFMRIRQNLKFPDCGEKGV